MNWLQVYCITVAFLFVSIQDIVVPRCVFGISPFWQAGSEPALMDDQLGIELLNTVVEQRRNIQEGQFELEWDYRGSPKSEFLPGRSTTFLRREKIRGERYIANQFRVLNGFGCHEGKFLQLTPWIDGKLAIVIKDSDKVSRHVGDTLEPDPRFLGLLPAAWLHSALFKPDSFFVPTSKVDVTSEIVDELNCKKIKFTNHAGREITLWVVPSMGNGVLKVSMREVTDSETSKVIESVIQSRLSKLNNSELWFPATTSFENKVNGIVDRQEEMRVKGVSLRELPNEIFSIAGIDLIKPGTQVVWQARDNPSEGMELVWDGQQIRVSIENANHSFADGDPADFKPGSSAIHVFDEMVPRADPIPYIARILLGLTTFTAGVWLIWKIFQHRNGHVGIRS